MIAQKADRMNENPAMTFRLQTQNRFLNGRADPGPARHPLTLEGEDPVVGGEANVFCDQRGRFLGLRLVGIAVGDGSLWDAVGCEDHGQLYRR